MSGRMIISALLLALACPPALHAAQKPIPDEALAGLDNARVIFDVRVPDSEKLLFNLKLLKETYEGIAAQGVKPEMIVAFRGPGVKLLMAATLDKETHALFRTLKEMGVRFEACAVAMRIFKVDPAGLIPEVKLVDNVFYSLIGYQNKGYATIAIN